MQTEAIIRKSLAIIAVAGLAIPLAGVAGAASPDSAQTARSETLFYDRSGGDVVTRAEDLYARLKDKSREICGTSNVRVTGSIERSVGNEECYHGTLTAAVGRLDDPAVSALHHDDHTAL